MSASDLSFDSELDMDSLHEAFGCEELRNLEEERE